MKKIRSEETCQNISIALKGRKRPPFSAQWIENLSKASKGRKRSKEHAQNIAKSMVGKNKRPMKEETKIKISLALTGRNVFTGFVSTKRKRLMQTLDYKKWREFIFRREDYTCFDCKKRGGDLEAHHIKQYSLYPELALHYANGITLCKQCHKKRPVIKKTT